VLGNLPCRRWPVAPAFGLRVGALEGCRCLPAPFLEPTLGCRRVGYAVVEHDALRKRLWATAADAHGDSGDDLRASPLPDPPSCLASGLTSDVVASNSARSPGNRHSALSLSCARAWEWEWELRVWGARAWLVLFRRKSRSTVNPRWTTGTVLGCDSAQVGT
jgi:hypothetical protein